MKSSRTPRALILGASRGLGFALSTELVKRGWHVTATARQTMNLLADAASRSDGALQVECVEMTDDRELSDLAARLGTPDLDLLFVNAAINLSDGPITDVSTDEFVDIMVTNALSPLRAVEALRTRVRPGGTVAVMSSEQGSVTRNVEDGYELYKASKAALNQLMRSYAARYADDAHTKLLIDPGHNRTSLGGPDAPFAPEDSMRAVADVLERHSGESGLQFLDRDDKVVPW